MTTNSQEKNDALWQAFKPLFDEIEKPREFVFHSADMTEDGSALLILFEGDDDRIYACSIPQGEKLGQQATLRRVD